MREQVPTSSTCADCGHPIADTYCGRCGQHGVEPPKTLRTMLGEFFGAYFNLEGKLWRTLWVLARRPGQLTVEYFAGRRTRYFTPVRLYLTTSFLFFTLAAVFGGHRFDTKSFHSALPSSLMGSSQPISATSGPDDSRLDAAADAFVDKMRELDHMPGEQQQLVMHTAATKMASETPKALFLLLPLFALFFKLAFFRRYYAEAFVFTLHLHAFAFLAFVPRIFATSVWLNQLTSAVGLTVTLIYGAIALKRFFQPTLAAGVLKVVFVGATYTVTLGAVMAVEMYRAL